MSIFDRIRRIAASNISAALDNAENPEKLLRQRVRELEETVGDAKKSLSEFAVSLKKTEREYEQTKRLRDEWQHKAEISLQAGEEETARNALRERVSAEDRVAALEPSLTSSKETYGKLKNSLAGLQGQLREAKLKLAELRTRKSAADARKRFGATLDKAAGNAADGEGDMGRMEDQVLQAESEAEIEAEIRGDQSDVTAETEKKSAELRLDAELDALKQKMGK